MSAADVIPRATTTKAKRKAKVIKPALTDCLWLVRASENLTKRICATPPSSKTTLAVTSRADTMIKEVVNGSMIAMKK